MFILLSLSIHLKFSAHRRSPAEGRWPRQSGSWSLPRGLVGTHCGYNSVPKLSSHAGNASRFSPHHHKEWPWSLSSREVCIQWVSLLYVSCQRTSSCGCCTGRTGPEKGLWCRLGKELCATGSGMHVPGDCSWVPPFVCVDWKQGFGNFSGSGRVLCRGP